MSHMAAESLTVLLQNALVEGAALTPSVDVAGALVRNRCGELAQAAVGSYQRSGASTKTAAVNPPVGRWGYASITKTLVGVVMQMLMANESLPLISWNDKLHQWLPLSVGTAYENASLLDVASHTACLPPEGAPTSQEMLAEWWQRLQEAGHPGAREVWVNNTFNYPPSPNNCIPELNTVHAYVHVDGVQILALIEESISGMDFKTLAQTLIFDPLGMSSAEVVDANPAGGLRATLSDLAVYGQWLVDGYNNHPDALAKTLLKHQDFVDLMSPISKHGVQQPTGRTFAVWLENGRRVAGHGGCLGAMLRMVPEEDLVVVMALSPEDAAWGSCDVTNNWASVLWSTEARIYSAFSACDHRPYHMCTEAVEGLSLTCQLAENLSLDAATLDAPYKVTSCREDQFSDTVKAALATYKATAPDFWSKAFVVFDNCQWAVNYYTVDPCESMRESFKICEQNNAECGVYLIGNRTYNPVDFPCRCGAFLRGSCRLSAGSQCSREDDINTTCLGATGSTTTALTDSFQTSSAPGTASTVSNPPGGMSSGQASRFAAATLLNLLIGTLLSL